MTNLDLKAEDGRPKTEGRRLMKRKQIIIRTQTYRTARNI